MFSFMRLAIGPLEPFLARLLIIVFLALGPIPALAPAATPQGAVPCTKTEVRALVLGSFLDKFFSFVSSIIGSQQRMIQFGIIGVCIGLYFLMKR